MQLVILAGGKGTRISEETISKPKPLVDIGGVPIILHVMNIYSKFGVNEFIICGGYKINLIKEYFANYYIQNSDIEINVGENKLNFLNKRKQEWKIKIINTGLNSETGTRLFKIRKYIEGENFFLTYSDGLANIDIKALYNHHLKKKKLVTVTAVNLPSRFGKLFIGKNNLISDFNEKPKLNDWISGGFFVFSKNIFHHLNNKCSLERDILEKISSIGEMNAFKHNDFWYPMDTLRDKEYLDELCRLRKAPWKN